MQLRAGQSGMTLVEVMVGLGIMVITVVGILVAVVNMSSNNVKSDIIRKALTTKYLIYRSIQSPTVWKKSMDNTAKQQLPGYSEIQNCLQNSNGCSVPADPNEWYKITLFDENDQKVDVSIKEANYQIEWKPICQDGSATCLHPILFVRAKLENLTPSLSSSLGAIENFEIKSTAGLVVDEDSGYCVSLGGQIDNGQCRLSFFGQTCPEGQYVVSLNPFQCRSLLREPVGCKVDKDNTFRIRSVQISGAAVCERAY